VVLRRGSAEPGAMTNPTPRGTTIIPVGGRFANLAGTRAMRDGVRPIVLRVNGALR
jgi:hypothetical protein